MIVNCPNCGAKYQYDEARFGGAATKKLKCVKCETVFEVHRPDAVAAPEGQKTAISGKKKLEETTKELDLKAMGAQTEDSSLPQLAPLSPNRRYSLAVILGANAGQIYPITRPRVVLGRGAGSDIQLPDSETSRRHAMLEIHDDVATLVDLESTNGTFLDGVRVQRATLASHQEFSLGSTTIMLIVTEVHEQDLA